MNARKSWYPRARITVLVGHFGSGKTEIALNSALAIKRSGEEVTLVDLDIVNPYFRSAVHKEALESKGVEVITPTFALSSVDIPALSNRIQSVFVDKTRRVVFDVGGDETGAVALGRYKPFFEQDDYDALFVVNAYRPMSETADEVMTLMRLVESRARLKISGLVHNSNIAHVTMPEDVTRGARVIDEASRLSGVPVVAVAGMPRVLKGMKGNLPPTIELERLMKPEWMEG